MPDERKSGGLPDRTPNGYSPWELISALQKAVRVGQEDLAMRWLYELDAADCLWFGLNRLRVIAHEDVGMGDPLAVMFALQSIGDCERFKRAEKGSYRLAMANAVMSLCRASKSREADHFQAAIRGRIARGWHPEIPNVALDKHTRRGKAMGRGVAHFEKEGTKLVPLKDATATETYRMYEKEAFDFWYAVERGELPENPLDPQGTLL